MSHHHHHTPENQSAGRLFLTMMLNFIITIAEIIGGLVSGSLSLISDALHNFSDGIALIISYIAIRLNRRPKSVRYTFGMKRAEIFAAIINAGTLIFICFYLFKESYMRLMHPEPVQGKLMVFVALIGLTANVIGTLLLRSGAKESMNIRASYLHLLSDAVSSVAVVIGGLFITFFNIYWIDPVLTVLIALYVLKESIHIVKEAVNMMMMAAPEGIAIENIQKELEALPNISNIHHVHLWQLNDKDIHFEAHVDVPDMKVSESNELLKQAENILHEEFDINHVTLQFECGQCKVPELV